jgi:hypothetical protein
VRLEQPDDSPPKSTRLLAYPDLLPTFAVQP